MDNRKDKRQCCANCYYAELFPEPEILPGGMGEPDLSEYVPTSIVCHRYPPALITIPDGSYTDFPSPDPQDWCGEFLSKE